MLMMLLLLEPPSLLQTGPECTSIQEQVEPNQPPDPEYIVTANGSYIKFENGFVDGPTLPTTTVDLTCFFASEGNKPPGMSIKCIFNGVFQEN